MPFAAAISEHPLTAHAAGEVTGSVLESIGERPDLAIVFVTAAHAGALEDVAATVDAVLHPLVTLGAASEGVIGPHREVEASPAVSLFAARTGPLLPFALDTKSDPLGGVTVSGWPESIAFDPKAFVVLADPYSFPAEAFLEWLAPHYPQVPVAGGMASGARGPGGTRLLAQTTVRSSGAVGVAIGPGVDVETVVSSGCKRFGQPLVVTRSDGNVIFELAGKPALERLVAQASSTLTPAEIDVIERGGLLLGRVVEERADAYGNGDFVMRSVLGADRRNGAIAVADTVGVGATVQFHLRDADSADSELAGMLGGREADGALLFACNGRGTHLFPQPHHDATAVAEALGPLPLGGLFVAGELGAVGGQNFVHSLSASLVLLRDADA